MMQNLTGVALTFGVAAAVSVAILAIERTRRPSEETRPMAKTR
jgi:hypothetical protein